MKHAEQVHSAQFSPDGQRVVTASEDNTARVWDAATGNAIGQPMKHEGVVYSARFSPDGQRVVTASEDNTARVWDVPVTMSEAKPDDVLLLADLAEAACVSALQTSGQAEILKLLPLDQMRDVREKIDAKFETQALTPLERFLTWSVSNRRHRTISPFSKLKSTCLILGKIVHDLAAKRSSVYDLSAIDNRLLRSYRSFPCLSPGPAAADPDFVVALHLNRRLRSLASTVSMQ
jgi:hypothetical protein